MYEVPLDCSGKYYFFLNRTRNQNLDLAVNELTGAVPRVLYELLKPRAI